MIDNATLADAGLVFRREFFGRVRSGMFLGGLAFSLVLIIGGVILAKVLEGQSDTVGLVGPQPGEVVEQLPTLAEDAGFSAVTTETFESREDLESAVMDGSVDLGVVNGDELVVKNGNKALVGFISLVWQQARFESLMDGTELDRAQQQAVAAATDDLPLTELEPDPESEGKEIVGVILVMLLFVAVQFMGGLTVISVTEEKGNNIVELLLSSMSSRALLLGKLVASGLLGLLQVSVLVGVGILVVNLADIADIPALPPSLLLVALTWFIIGFAFFGVLITAGAALAPSQEDAQAVLTPVFGLVLAGYLASVFVASNPDDPLSRLVSFLPFVSPFVMPARFLTGDLTFWEHGLALVIAVASLAAALNIGARIYTRSVIHTDRKLGWLEAFRAEAVR